MSKVEGTVVQLYKKGVPQRKIATKLNLARSSVQRILYRNGLNTKNKSVKTSSDKLIDDLLDKQNELNLRREIADSVKEVAFRDKLTFELEKHAKVLQAPPAYKCPPKSNSTVTETLLLHLSDWHADEVVRQEAVIGLNSYNSHIVEKRVGRIVGNTIEIKDRLQKGGHRFPSLVVAMNGDMVSGTIHEIEKHTDSGNIIKSVLKCAELLATAIRDLAGEFENVYCFGTSGNHGRLPDAKKVQLKDPTRSWDYLIYKYAELALKDCENVHIEIPDSWAVMYEIDRKMFYQGHGHFIKSWNSIPFYGISRLTSRLGAVLNKHYRPVDYWLFGHFHVNGSIENAGGEYLVNPSLIGPQEFGVHCLGDATSPGQSLYGVHAKYGITHRWKLNAEETWPTANRSLPATKIKNK